MAGAPGQVGKHDPRVPVLGEVGWWRVPCGRAGCPRLGAGAGPAGTRPCLLRAPTACRGPESPPPPCRHAHPRTECRAARSRLRLCVTRPRRRMTQGPESDLPETTRGSVGKHEGARLSVTARRPARGTAPWASQGGRLCGAPGQARPLLTAQRSGRLGGWAGLPSGYRFLVLPGKWPPAGLLGGYRGWAAWALGALRPPPRPLRRAVGRASAAPALGGALRNPSALGGGGDGWGHSVGAGLNRLTLQAPSLAGPQFPRPTHGGVGLGHLIRKWPGVRCPMGRLNSPPPSSPRGSPAWHLPVTSLVWGCGGRRGGAQSGSWGSPAGAAQGGSRRAPGWGGLCPEPSEAAPVGTGRALISGLRRPAPVPSLDTSSANARAPSRSGPRLQQSAP